MPHLIIKDFISEEGQSVLTYFATDEVFIYAVNNRDLTPIITVNLSIYEQMWSSPSHRGFHLLYPPLIGPVSRSY